MFSLFRKYLPLEKAWPFIWTNLYTFHPRMLCTKFSWYWPSGYGEEKIWISSNHFRYFVIIFPWKRVSPFIWTNLNSLHPRMLCATFNWNWLCGSGEEDENVKSLQTDRQTEGRRTKENRRPQMPTSYQLRWAKKPFATVLSFSSTVEITDKKWGL